MLDFRKALIASAALLTLPAIASADSSSNALSAASAANAAVDAARAAPAPVFRAVDDRMNGAIREIRAIHEATGAEALVRIRPSGIVIATVDGERVNADIRYR